MSSHHAAGRAADLGFRNVYVMGDGISGWVKAGKPVEKG
jgi:rhodanese-related sulfurtransferase